MGLRGPGAKPVEETKRRTVRTNKLSRPERVIRFIESLTITSGMHAGRKFKLRPWQKEIIGGIYRTDANGRRIVRQALITMGRKNGKTQLAAALALAHLCGTEAEQRGQVYSAATDRQQASLLFAEMRAMILADPELAGRIIIRDFNKNFEDTVTGSTFTALSADAKTKAGLNASCIIYDELGSAPDRRLYDVLSTSTAARSEPLMIVISTQSGDPHAIMTELVHYGEQVRDGVIDDPTFYPVIYTAPMDAEWTAEKTWHLANPALGDFRSIEEMRTACQQAQRIPAREQAFRLLYLNQPVSGDSRFISSSDWEACAGEYDIESLRGRPCYGGLDLGSTTDLTSLVLYFPEDDGAVIPYFWCPQERLQEREHGDRVPYPLWVKQGLLEAPAGRAIDRKAIVCRIAEITSMFDVKGMAYDRWRLEDLKKLLADEGIDIPVEPWGQGFKDMAPAVDALETAILNQTIQHPDHPILTWNIANAVVEVDPTGARKITKEKSIERVDGLVALVMAMGLYARQPKQKIYSYQAPILIRY